MKYIKYLLLVFPLAAMLASCDKHDLGYADSDELKGQAQYQITYVRPVSNTTATRIDSLFMNGKKIAGVGGSGALTVNGTLPGPARYFTCPTGANHLVLYNRGTIVYEQDITLDAKRQRIFIYDFNQAPIIHTELDEYKPLHKDGARADEETFDTDTIMRLRLFNFFFESPTTPYAEKVQYQWSNNYSTSSPYTTGDWHNLGEPIGFGEATDYEEVIIHKKGVGGSGFNSAGYQTIRYRCVDANGNTIARTTDYWSGYSGRWVTHTLRGCRTGSPSAGYSQLNANVNI